MVQKVSKKLKLNLRGIPTRRRSQVKEEVGDFVVEQINEYLDRQESPVTKERKAFRKLKKDYAQKKRELVGNAKANLELFNEMRPAIEHQIDSRGMVEIGLFEDEQVQKADNHNKRSAKSKKTKVPKRRFIPEKNQNFRRDIQRGIKEIIENARENK